MPPARLRPRSFASASGSAVSRVHYSLVAVPVLTPVIATGFSVPEKKGLAELAWYFLPWTLICLPYYAAAARYKMEWRFNRVFVAEILIIVISIGALALWHDDIEHLPLAYAAGYMAGLLLLIVGAGLVWPKKKSARPSLRAILTEYGRAVWRQSIGQSCWYGRPAYSILCPGRRGGRDQLFRSTDRRSRRSAVISGSISRAAGSRARSHGQTGAAALWLGVR